MSEEWGSGDLFDEPADPAAIAREQRRREREERRGKAAPDPLAAAAPGPPSESRPPDRPPPPPPPPVASGGARRRLPLLIAAIAAIGVLAVAAIAYRHFHRSSAPAPVAEPTVTVTIPEGYDRAQIAALAREDGLRGDYVEASVRSRFLKPARYGGRGAKSLEGFLFPDTFELRRHAPVSDLVQLQLEDFKRRIRGVDMSYARSKNLTTFDVLTIASMIEREAMVANERKLVAAVIYNRLHEGMPLGIDATIRFATGNYTKPLTESELAIESPYNTRTNLGLPPGPIGNPGLASIEAAAHPARVGYLFYVVEPGTCGKLAFSKTEAEFEADVTRYDEAREAAGGNSPTSCGE